MAEYILTLLDTAGIQDFIFGSNRLQENIGASEQVYRATTLWVFDALDELKLKHNVRDGNTLHWWLDETATVPDVAAEVIYAGGGNTLVLFRDPGQETAFTRKLTRYVLDAAPGLTVTARHAAFKWGQDSLKDALDQMWRDLAAHKQSRLPSLPTLGLGVSAACQSTGLPAVQNNVDLRLPGETETRLVSRRTAGNLKWRNPSNERLQEWLGEAAGGFTFPYDLDKLGRLAGEESYVAVIHADGNRMGEHLNHVLAGAGSDPRAGITALRYFSMAVNAAGLSALQHSVAMLVQAIGRDEDLESLVVYEDGRKYLPFRPLVFGGDDVTFVCNGQVGVALAADYLETFEQAVRKQVDRAGKRILPDLFASAGVSIVKLHYPFARAYALSEQLTGSAKHLVRHGSSADCSALDWHFATGGLSGGLGDIRDREYKVRQGWLNLRPLRLRADGAQDGRYWQDGLQRVLHEFDQKQPWKDSHNKVLGLRSPLRLGKEKVAAYLRDYELPSLPELVPGEEPRRTGWLDDRCLYFDAVELLDHYKPI